MYDEVMNHFGARVLDRVYDITGDVTDDYDWEEWESLEDPYVVAAVTRDSILMV